MALLPVFFLLLSCALHGSQVAATATTDAATSAALVLGEHSTTSEQTCLDLLGSDSFDPVSVVSAKLVGFAMQRGHWKCAKELSNLANSLRIDVRSVFDVESRVITREINDIKATIESTLPVSTISPAFQWAQSPTEIFISVKFAHKLDAPATLNVEAETVNITETHLVLRATDGRKVFKMNIDFLRTVIPSESSWSMASVGRMTITLKKKTSGPRGDNWVRLTKTKKKPNNIHFWWELHEKHAKELEALQDEEDALDEDGGSGRDPVVKPPTKEAEVAAAVEPASTATAEASAGSEESGANPTKPKKEKKRKVKKDKKKDKQAILDDLVKELEKEGKEKKIVIDRQAKADKEAVNAETEAKVKELKRDYYKTPEDKKEKEEERKSKENTITPTDLDKLLPEEDQKEEL